MSKGDELASLIRTVAIAQGGGRVNHEVVAFLGATDDSLRLTWDKPHATGHTTHLVIIKFENLPKVAELLLGLYNDRKALNESEQEET